MGRDRTAELAACGWRLIEQIQPDGSVDYEKIPLTEAEFLHPQEGYRLPNSTFHDDVIRTAADILSRRYASDPTIGVFADLIVEWDIPNLKDHCPDVFVAFNLQHKDQNRGRFIVANEGTRPSLIIEVVSPRYRKADRTTKVAHYARAKVQEYVICDRRRYRGNLLEEVLGYRLVGNTYQPITPDAAGRIRCDTVGVWISLCEGALIMEDVATGQHLPTSLELEASKRELETCNQELTASNQELTVSNQELTVSNQELTASKRDLELSNQAMAAVLARYQARFGELPANNGEA